MSSWIEDTNKILRDFRSELRSETPITEDDNYEIKTIELETAFEKDVWDVVIGIYHLLIEKNRKYGDSALNPARIFSKADSVAQLHTRIDDKLSRIKNSSPDDNEDAVTDLLGYLILLKIAENNGA